MPSAIDLDHLAVAAETQADLWPRYAGDLGGTWVAGGPGSGFGWAQVRFANGMRVEALEPKDIHHNDFLRRFLDRNGPGPHHLTFKVPSLDDALAKAEELGYRPVSIDRSEPSWQECFLHPKDISGVVVQLAQAIGDDDSGPPAELPPARSAQPATLVHVAHAVRNLDDGLRLFADLLSGEEAGRGEDDFGPWLDLRWPGPGVVRLITVTDPFSGVGQWVGDRAGRIHHVTFRTTAPEQLQGAVPAGAGTWVVPPEANHGTRLRLLE
jgi:hypothetical protein